DHVCKNALSAVKIVPKFEFASVALVKNGVLKIKESTGFSSFPEKLRELPLDGPGLSVKAVNRRKTILVHDAHKHPDYFSSYPAVKSELAVPIKTKKEVLGVINVQSSKRNAFNQRDKRILEVLSSYVTVAIKKVQEREKFVSLRRLDDLRDQFLAMAAHEINTPLTIIKAKAELLKKKWYDERTREEEREVNKLLESVDRLARIVEDFRRISKLRTGQIKLEKSQCCLSSSVNKVLECYEESIKDKGIKLEKDVKASLSAIYDEDRIVQVIQNLLENAIDYTEDTIWVEGWEENGRLCLSVRDDGPGIPEEEQERIFDPFYRVEKERYREDRLFGGTGLGLTICKRIMDAHGGEIQVSSTLGEGTTFTIWLPKRTGVV
ncbi:MAG: GAF domain-containing protein, partial [Candidatus Korarchaeota archaeon]|nr:GAF domain-containing protein [Candidatus Korarchaeota archaeon]